MLTATSSTTKLSFTPFNDMDSKAGVIIVHEVDRVLTSEGQTKFTSIEFEATNRGLKKFPRIDYARFGFSLNQLFEISVPKGSNTDIGDAKLHVNLDLTLEDKKILHWQAGATEYGHDTGTFITFFSHFTKRLHFSIDPADPIKTYLSVPGDLRIDSEDDDPFVIYDLPKYHPVLVRWWV